MDNFLIFFILLILYIFILFILKKLSFGKKITSYNCNNCCPDCKSSLSRIKRKYFDYIIQHLTFRIFESPSATTSLWTESLSVFFENGYYNVVLGSDII